MSPTARVLTVTALATACCAGCAPSVSVVPAGNLSAERLCVVGGTVRSDFLDPIVGQLMENGYQVSVKNTVEEARTCPVWMTCGAVRDIDGWGYYLAKAQIRVFKGDKIVGSVDYQARGSPFAHGSIRNKLQDLVNQVLAGGAREDQTQSARLERLEQLHARGMIADEEYQRRRAELPNAH